MFSRINLQIIQLLLILIITSKYCLLLVHISFGKQRHSAINDTSFPVDCTIPEYDISFKMTGGRILLFISIAIHHFYMFLHMFCNMITLQFQGTWEGIFLPMVEHCSNRFFSLWPTHIQKVHSQQNQVMTVELQYFSITRKCYTQYLLNVYCFFNS